MDLGPVIDLERSAVTETSRQRQGMYIHILTYTSQTIHVRTPDIGPPPKSLSVKPIEVEVDGSSGYQVEDILDHRGRTGPLCECLVRWKDFDASHDSLVQRKFLTPLALQAYERFLTEHVRFCEERAKNKLQASVAY